MRGKKKGFTLMELVVVIAILAILGLMLYPQVNRYYRGARDEVAHQNLMTIYNHFTAQLTLEQMAGNVPESVYLYLCSDTNYCLAGSGSGAYD